MRRLVLARRAGNFMTTGKVDCMYDDFAGRKKIYARVKF
jgi:hypothetical protein